MTPTPSTQSATIPKKKVIPTKDPISYRDERKKRRGDGGAGKGGEEKGNQGGRESKEGRRGDSREQLTIRFGQSWGVGALVAINAPCETRLVWLYLVKSRPPFNIIIALKSLYL
jgi:hypothetical protein